MKCEYGYCLVCEREILATCKECGAKRPNGLYTEVKLKLSNGTQMPIATCLGCKDKVWKEDKAKIMEAVRAGWSKEHDRDNWSQERRDKYWQIYGVEALKIVD